VEKFLKVEDVNARPSPLYAAAQNGHADVVDLLLEKKANVDQARAEWEVGSCALPASSLGPLPVWCAGDMVWLRAFHFAFWRWQGGASARGNQINLKIP
jgi:hypothetical protein